MIASLRLLTVTLAMACHGYAQTYVDLDFSSPIAPTNGLYPNNSTLGPEYFSGPLYGFYNVASYNGMGVDARVEVVDTTGAYEFVGWLPHYNDANGQPDNDLGVYYRYTGIHSAPTGGISYVISFFESGSNFTNAVTLPAVRLLMYDHDGETGQSEALTAYLADGLTGYQTYNGSGISASNDSNAYTFQAGGIGKPETTADGGVLLYYQNTSSISITMTSTTSPSLEVFRYGVFTGIDGDLSLTGGSTTNFGGFQPVPEPTVPALAGAAAAFFLLRRRRAVRPASE